SVIGRTLWTLLVIAVGIWFVVWFARRAEHTTVKMKQAATGDRPDTIPDAATEVTASAASSEHPSTPPLEPPPGAPAEDLAAWRIQHAQWRTEIDEWKRQQAVTAREVRQQWTEESRSRAAAAAVANADRRRARRLANPRIGAPWVTITVGLAILLGAISGLVSSSNTDWAGYESVAGLGVATLTIALSGILAGALRRRSGFLGFLVAVLVVATVAAAVVPLDRQLSAVHSGYGAGLSASMTRPDPSDGGSN
ncbi:MAG: hypothetical protein QOI70_1694, partial [Microbacteriaceae bacterium]|nr:hypothetical protein [Microbacteriaceae bacterium]